MFFVDGPEGVFRSKFIFKNVLVALFPYVLDQEAQEQLPKMVEN